MNPLLKIMFVSKTLSWILGLFLAFASFGLMQVSLPFGVMTLILSILLLPVVEHTIIAKQGILYPLWLKPALAFLIFMTFGLIMT